MLSLLLKFQFLIYADDEKVARFVANLVSDAIASDSLQIHDVLLLQIEIDPKSDIFDQIARNVGPLSVMLSFDHEKPLQNVILAPTSMIIIVTDMTDKVIY